MFMAGLNVNDGVDRLVGTFVEKTDEFPMTAIRAGE
jgi:hypothetical protein